MKCFRKKLIYIKTNFFLYLVQCNVAQINLFTLELCLKNYFLNARFFEGYFAFNFLLAT